MIFSIKNQSPLENNLFGEKKTPGKQQKNRFTSNRLHSTRSFNKAADHEVIVGCRQPGPNASRNLGLLGPTLASYLNYPSWSLETGLRSLRSQCSCDFVFLPSRGQ